VLLDLNMPGAVGGTAVIATISKIASVVVVTATIDIDVARRTLREGAVDFIAEPFDFDRMRDVAEAAAVLTGER
jgi:FixJ family two-component response regulator